MDALKRQLRRLRREIALFLGAYLVYLPGIWWGLPFADRRDLVDVWSPDDLAPLKPLTELYNTLVASGSDRFLLYPLFHHFVLVAGYLPYLVWLVLTGRLQDPSPVFPFGFADPVQAFRVLTIISRVISVAMAAAIPVVAYRTALLLWDRRVAALAFVLTLAPYPMFYYSKTANLDVPVLFWTSLGLMAYVRIVVHGVTTRRFACLGAFAALAAATKDQGAAAFLLLPLVLLPLQAGAWREGRVSALGPPAGLLATGSLVYAFASGLVVDPERYLAHLRFLASPEIRNRGFEAYVTWYPVTPFGIWDLLVDLVSTLAWFLGPIALAASFAAMVLLGRQRRRDLALALPALGHVLTFLIPIHYFYIRFAMPVAYVLGLFGAWGLASFANAVRPRWLVRGTLALAIAWPLVLSGDLVFQMIADSRLAASDWIARNVSARDRLAHFTAVGELPRMDSRIETVLLPPGDRAFGVLERVSPEFVAILPDWTSPAGSPHSALCPPELYAALVDGSLGYELVARFKTPALIERQLLDYPSVNPLVQIFARRNREPQRSGMGVPPVSTRGAP